nr:MAG TPA: hypothetical protein [Caudoviricetes sp.]
MNYNFTQLLQTASCRLRIHNSSFPLNPYSARYT